MHKHLKRILPYYFPAIAGLAIFVLVLVLARDGAPSTPPPGLAASAWPEVRRKLPAGGESVSFLPLVVSTEREPDPGKGLATAYWPTACDDIADVGARFTLGWHPIAPPCFDPAGAIEYTAMIARRKDIGAELTTNSDYLMTFNEPDLCGADWWFTCMTPAEAAGLYRQVEDLYPSFRLVAPGVSGLERGWLEDWRESYINQFGQAPRVDVLTFHCYDALVDCVERSEYYIGLARAWGIPEVWVSEYSVRECHWAEKTDAQTIALTNWFEDNPMISRYYWFTNRNDPDWNNLGIPDCATVTHDWETGDLTHQGELLRDLPGVP